MYRLRLLAKRTTVCPEVLSTIDWDDCARQYVGAHMVFTLVFSVVRRTLNGRFQPSKRQESEIVNRRNWREDTYPIRSLSHTFTGGQASGKERKLRHDEKGNNTLPIFQRGR